MWLLYSKQVSTYWRMWYFISKCIGVFYVRFLRILCIVFIAYYYKYKCYMIETDACVRYVYAIMYCNRILNVISRDIWVLISYIAYFLVK